MNSDILVGNWVCTVEGISQIIEIRHTYKEEYSISYGQSYKIGEIFRTFVIYKVYCSFSGKVRKRDHVKSCVASLCAPLSEDLVCTLNSLRNFDKSFNDKFDSITKVKLIDYKIRTSIYVNPLISKDVVKFSNSYVFKSGIFANDFFRILSDRFQMNQEEIFINPDQKLSRISLVLFNDDFLFIEKKSVITGVFAEAFD